MAVATKAGFPNEMDKEIDRIFFDQYLKMPPEFSLIAKMGKFPEGDEYTESEMTGLGQFEEIHDAEPVPYDIPAEGHKKTVKPLGFGKGFQITEWTLQDDLHGNWKKLPATLAKGAADMREVQFWNLFNNGFSGGGELAWDGLSIFNDSHQTLKSLDTIDNCGAADLDDTSLKAAFEYFDDLVDEAGFPMRMTPSMLVIPTALKWQANTLQKATGRVWSYSDMSRGLVGSGTTGASGSGTANYQVPVAGGPLALPNLLQPSYGIVDDWSILASHYLTDADAWFLISRDHDMRFWTKQELVLESQHDFNTRSMMYQATMRFRAFCMAYRGVYGSAGA